MKRKISAGRRGVTLRLICALALVFTFAPFGFGQRDVSAEYSAADETGDSWYFRLAKQKVRLWQNGRFGYGCSGSSLSDNAGGVTGEFEKRGPAGQRALAI